MKKIMVTRSSMPDIDEYIDEIRSIWESRWLTNMGVKHQLFAAALKEYLSVGGVELVSNGHMALELSLQALRLPQGGEVITTPFTFASTTHAIVRNGLNPVFCDVDEKTCCIDVDKIENLITDKTCAILPVHVYGNICDVEAIEKIAKKYHLAVVYDAAHAFGETYKGIGVGAFGRISCFSFHATKVFHSIEGGAVCYQTDDNIGREIYRLKNFGIKDEEIVDGVGANAKMNEFCAAMGLCNLRHIEEAIDRRGKVVSKYRELLKGVKGLKILDEQKDVKTNNAYFPIFIDAEAFGVSREDVHLELMNKGINLRKYFYPLTSDFDCYQGMFDNADTPVAKRLSLQVLTLPLYEELELVDVEKIAAEIKSLAS